MKASPATSLIKSLISKVNHCHKNIPQKDEGIPSNKTLGTYKNTPATLQKMPSWLT